VAELRSGNGKGKIKCNKVMETNKMQIKNLIRIYNLILMKNPHWLLNYSGLSLSSILRLIGKFKRKQTIFGQICSFLWKISIKS